MTRRMKKLLRDGLGAIGDRANKKGCPLIFYQPRACKRGESREQDISKGKEADR